MKESSSLVASWMFAATVMSAMLVAQSPCAPAVLPGILKADSAPVGVTFAVTSVDPDGAGPLPESLVVGGDFGGDNVALWDASAEAWLPMGAGIAGSVRLLATMPNGDVIAGVQLPPAGSGITDIRRWDGTNWTSLATSISGSAYALHALPNGDLLVGGDFTAIDGVAVDDLAVWDGSSWSQFAGGVTGSFARVTAFGTLQNGDLVVGGKFSAIGGVTANSIATWDGVTFAPLGSGLAAAAGPLGSAVNVAALKTRANGDLFVCGAFQSAGGVFVNNVALWNGSTWSAMGAGVGGASFYDGWLASAEQLPNGDLVVGGASPINGIFSGVVHRWDGATWSQYGDVLGYYGLSVRSFPGGLIAAGSELAQFDGSTWQPIDGSGATDAQILAAIEMPTGEIVVGGSMSMLNGTVVHHIAMWNGTAWSTMAGGTDGPVRHLALLPNGDLIATGSFTTAGGTIVNRIARWDGSSWSALGAGTPVPCVPAVLANGDVVVSGEYSAFTSIGGVAANDIARWDGATWSAMGGGLSNSSYTYALHAAANGDVYASSLCADPANPAGGVGLRILRWDGSSWSTVGGQMNGLARDMLVLPNGDLIAGGKFSAIGGVAANRVARWNGNAWSPLGAGITGDVYGVERLPNGDLFVAGFFTQASGNVGNHLARWNGAAWTTIGTGANDNVTSVSLADNGDVLLVGLFDEIDGVSAPQVARLTTTCPASVVTLGAACAGSGGNNQLTADSLPWTGSTFSMTGTGLAPLSLIAIDGGLAPLGPISLASLGLPAAPPSCMLHIQPTYYEVALTTTGELSSSWSIPNSPVFAGVNVYWQYVVFEVDPALTFLETTSTNALELTIGSF